MNSVHKHITVRIVSAVAAITTLSALLCLTAFAQTFVVRGVVTTSSGAARFASVTFVDKGDTTKKTSVVTDTAGKYSINIVTSVTQISAPPSEFKLEQNYPNPFSFSTEISYQIKKQADVTVTVYDILGREIRRFAAGIQSAGVHGMLWDGKNNSGEVVSRGVYFYQLRSQNETLIKKMLYGFGGNDMTGSSAGFLTRQVAESRKEANAVLLVGSHTVRIANTDSTFPPVIGQQFDNVTIQSNATLDFSVSTNGTFPDPTAANIYTENPQQVIRGFGGANILQWRPDMTSAQVQKAFGSGPGQVGFSILRLRVPYDTAGGAFKMQVPTAKLAQSLGAIVFASPWTPPPAMKSNNNIVAGTLNESSYSAYAAYLKSFAAYMAANGAPLYAISLQNEPDCRVTYESCDWTSIQFLNFMKNNAASIGSRIMMPESQNFVHALSDPTLSDSVAAANTAIIAGHLYGGGLAAYPLAVSKGKEI